MGGWDSCNKDTQSGEPADSTHRTNLKDETGEVVSTGESRMGGHARGKLAMHQYKLLFIPKWQLT